MGLAELKEWAEINIAPNVEAIHRIDELKTDGEVERYDVHVLITVNAEGLTTITTQPVNCYNGKFSLARNEVRNYKAPESKTPIELELIAYLDTAYGADNYKLLPPIDTTAGKAAVVEVNGEKSVIAKLNGEIVARKFGG